MRPCDSHYDLICIYRFRLICDSISPGYAPYGGQRQQDRDAPPEYEERRHSSGGRFGGGGSGYQQQRGGTPPAGGAQRSRHPAVEQDRWYLKRALVPYRTSGKAWFNKVGGAVSDLDVLDTQHLARRNTHLNAEAFNRPAHWLSMLCGTVRAAATELTKRVTSPTTGISHHTGIAKLSEYFASDEGQELLKACSVLDLVGNPGARTPEAIEDALVTLCTFLAEANMVTDVQRVALFSAQQYVMSMNLLEAFSVFENREHWAEELAQQSDEHPEEVQRFVARPNSDDALVRALSACLQTNMQQELLKNIGENTLEAIGANLIHVMNALREMTSHGSELTCFSHYESISRRTLLHMFGHRMRNSFAINSILFADLDIAGPNTRSVCPTRIVLKLTIIEKLICTMC